MRVIGLSVADDFSVDGGSASLSVLVVFQNADTSSLSRKYASGTHIKRAIGTGIIAREAIPTVGHDEQNSWIKGSLAAARDDDIGSSTPDGAIGDAQSIQAAEGIIRGCLAIALEAVTNRSLPN